MKLLSFTTSLLRKFTGSILKRKALSLFLFFILIISIVVINFYIGLPDVKTFTKGIPGNTSMMVQRIEESKNSGKRIVIRRKWAPFPQIPDLLKKTVIISEDIDFYNHKGIDYFELKESIKKNLKTGKRSRGGSTITQQLAKNLFLSTEKSYYRKIKEFFLAKRLEKHLSKDRILELYLNVIEFGRGIFGVGAASEFFFNKRIDQLENFEIIRLISVIPKPLRVTPLSDSGYMKWRANLLIDRLLRSNSITTDEYDNIKIYFSE
ncbi:MAG: biosynthetic peptidoglycan transglycosylase [Acidobacteriota bacterium]